MEKPEALRLADWLEDQYDPTYNQEQAAAELRRQHGEIKSMRAERLRSERRLLDVKAQRDALLEALQNLDANPELTSAWLQARDAIKAVEEGK